MTDPNTPTQPTNSPQDLIDQALGGASLTPTPSTEAHKEEVAVNPQQPLTTPEPLSQTASDPAVVEPSADAASTPPPTTDSVPAELTNTQAEPAVLPEPPTETKPMGEDMPLAFMDSAAVDASTTTQQAAPDITVEPISPAITPTTLAGNSNNIPVTGKPKKKGLKVVGVVAGVLLLLGVVGAASYQMLTGESLIAAIYEPKFIRDSTGKVIKNPNFDPDKIVKDDNGNNVRQEDLRNKELGIKQEPAKDVSGLGKSACEKSGSGGQWCESVDSKGKPYAFCMLNDGSQGNCNNRAIELGYTIQIGNLQNVSCECKSLNKETRVCLSWAMDAASQNAYEPYGQETLNKANELCNTGKGTINFGSGSYICREGKAGKGGVVYTGGACTEANGFSFGGNLGCFCGTVQVDTPNGHTSYSSTCGCEEEEETTTSNPSPSPSTPVTASLMCTSLTRTPTTTPAVGDKVTFTCVGASTPAGAVSLTYKFRYSLNSGAYVAMTNKTATTSELTIAACGSYKVQCQACGTINGVLTCDPNWTAATQ